MRFYKVVVVVRGPTPGIASRAMIRSLRASDFIAYPFWDPPKAGVSGLAKSVLGSRQHSPDVPAGSAYTAMNRFPWHPPELEGKRPLHRPPDDHHFWSLIMLAVTAGGFLLVTWVATKAVLFFLQESPIP